MGTFIRQSLKLIGIWLALTLLCFAVAKWTFGTDDRFARMTAETTGVVTEKLPHEHRTIRFRYSINGADYSGAGATDFGNPPFDDITVGQRITVFYNPENPESATSGDRRSEPDANTGPVILMTLFAPIFLLVQLIRKRWI